MEKWASKFFSAFLLVLIAGAVCASAQQQGCDFPTAASRDAFLRFDREFRAALTEKDAGKLALLVRYPLHVNDPNGNYDIGDASGMARRIDSIFPQKVRDAIFAKPAQSLLCNGEGVAYGDGVVWVGWPGNGYSIQTVNLPGDPPRTPNQVLFSCNYGKGRAVVESSGEKDLRLRVWTSARLLTDEPNVQSASGSSRVEGTDGCAHTIWSFEQNGTHFKLEQLGCTEDTPPNNAVGRFESMNAGEPETSYCF